MRIAVYSGSFNPLHTGHLAILEHLSDCGDFDGTYLIVSPKNPLKEGADAASGKSRHKAALEAVDRHPGLRVRVDSIELEMEPPHYSIRTLDTLRSREPENTFTLVIGADNFANFRDWRDYRRILLEYGVAVYPRTGFDLTVLRDELMEDNPSYRIGFIDAPIVDISSTEIRRGLAEGRDMSQYLM